MTLQGTLEYAEPAERKEMLREHIRVVNVPKTGPALLETNPEWLLSSLDGLRVIGDPEGSRTPVSRVRTWCPRPLNDGVTSLIKYDESKQIYMRCQENRLPVAQQYSSINPYKYHPCNVLSVSLFRN